MNIIEIYVKKNLPINHDLQKITNMLSDLLDEDDSVVYYIPGSKMTSELIFTQKKLIVAQRFQGEWGGDIILPYEDIHNLKIKQQNKLLFIKLDLVAEIAGTKFYIKKSEADNFKNIMWDVFEIK